MRTLRLAEAVAQAERLRLKAMAGRMVMRVVFAAIAGVFGFCALLSLDVALAALLTRWMAIGWAFLIVAVLDLVVAGVLILLAMRNTPSAEEQAALTLRRDAWVAVKRDLAFTGLLSTAMTVYRRSRRR